MVKGSLSGDVNDDAATELVRASLNPMLFTILRMHWTEVTAAVAGLTFQIRFSRPSMFCSESTLSEQHSVLLQRA